MADIPKLSPVTSRHIALRGVSEMLSRVAARADTGLVTKTDKNLRMESIPGVGQTLAYDGPEPDFPWLLYKIVAAGPAAEADYTNNRYWVAPAFLLQSNTDTDTTAANPVIEDGDAGGEIVTATNLSEAATQSHLLPIGSFVWVRQMRGRSSDGTTLLQWIMETPSGATGMFPVKVKRSGTVTPPVYNAYALSDSGYATPLNGTVTLTPQCSRARWNGSLTITAASDGSYASAFYDAGVLKLFELPETLCGA